jgi:hypothetical protein
VVCKKYHPDPDPFEMLQLMAETGRLATKDRFDEVVVQPRTFEGVAVGAEDGRGVAEMFDQIFRVYGTDTLYPREGELAEGAIFHGRFISSSKVSEPEPSSGRK